MTTTAPPARLGFGLRFATPLLIGSSLNPINSTLIAIALAPISKDLGVPASTAIWLVTSLYITSAIAQPTFGKLADLVGPKRVLIIGLVVVGVAGAIPVASPTFGAAIASRVLLGAGTSAAYPAALTAIRQRANAEHDDTPATLLSALSISSLVTVSIGPFLAGLLILAFGWPAIFAVNVPLAAVTILLAALWLPADQQREHRGTGRTLASLDPAGLALFAITIVALMLFLLELHAELWWLLALAVLAGAALVLRERRTDTPFLDLRLLASNGPLTRTLLRFLLVFLAIYLVGFAFSQWVQDARGLSAGTAGLAQLPYALVGGAASVLVRRTTRVRGPLLIAAVVPLVAGAGFAVLSGAPVWVAIVLLALIGVPQGLGSIANQSALYQQTPPDSTGAAGGLSRTATYLGAIIATAVIGLVFGQRPTDAGMAAIGVAIAVVSAGLLLLTLLDQRLTPSTTTGSH